MSSDKLKILICGDVESQFDAIFDKVRKLNKQSSFSFLLCVGNFFNDSKSYESIEKYKSGAKTIPVPTYILGPNTEEQAYIYEKLGIDESNNEICTNLNYLGKSGIYTFSSGVTLAYLSGREVKEGETKESWHFDQKDVDSVKNSAIKNFSNLDEYRGIDFLVTSQWAYGVNEDSNSDSSKLISYLALHVKPRYHCCGLNNVHFEKMPFRFPAANARSIEPVSRFIALAKVNNELKSKFLYALNIMPLSMMRLTDLMLKSTDEVECPYLNLELPRDSKDNQDVASNAQFFWDQKNDNNKRERREHRQPYKKFKPMIDQEQCWFCLQSKELEKHLIISIGENFYLALAKNPVSNYHVLIIPISHIQAVSQLSDELFDELELFKKSIKKFFDSEELCAVFFERNYMSSHSIVNAVGIPKSIEWQLGETLKDKAEEFNLVFEDIPRVSSPKNLPERGPYFVIEWRNDQSHITRSMKGFPINFGRDLVCAETLLNAEDKIDWRNCQLPRNLEDKYVATFKAGYKPFDFNDDGDNDDDDDE